MDWAMTWWVWLAAAIVLAALEITLPGFILLGFAIGAAVVGFLLLTPLSLSISTLWVIFAVLSLVSWYVLRRVYKAPDNDARIITEDINK